MSYLAPAKHGKRRELSELSEERGPPRGLSSHSSLNSQRYLCKLQEVERLVAAAERTLPSPDALEDAAEVMLRGEIA
jgi:hypothetical protein